jgi:hypothetical protein
MTLNLPTPTVTEAILTRAVGIAAAANKRYTQEFERVRCPVGTKVGTAEKGAILAEMDLLIFAFYFAFESASVLFYFFSMRKQ